MAKDPTPPIESVAGPIGFVGLVAPRWCDSPVLACPEVHRHRVLLPLSGFAGVLVVVAADVLLRMVLGGQGGVDIPTGMVTTLFGAAVLVWLARRYRDSGPTRQPPIAGGRAVRTVRTAALMVLAAIVVTTAAAALGMLAGDTWVLTGDIGNWINGRSGRAVMFVLDARFPRVVAALLAGAALVSRGRPCRRHTATPWRNPASSASPAARGSAP